jgi:hypothetical protein
VSKSKNTVKAFGPNGDDRKQANRVDRKKTKEFLAEGQYEAVPSEQKLRKKSRGVPSE